MKGNAELKERAWRRLWADKWFGRLFGGGLLLGLCGWAVQTVIRGVLGHMNVQSWQDYAEAVMMNRQDLTTVVPNLTSDYVSQATSSTVLLVFFSWLMAGIASYGGAVVLRRCLANDEPGWLGAAFGGFKCPFEMLWMYVRRILIYAGWALLGALPLGLLAVFCHPFLSAQLAAGSLFGMAALAFLLMAGLSVELLLLCVPFYRYRFLFLVKADRPDLGANACFRRCRELMRGNLLKSFRLDCSYWRPIAWMLVLCLSLMAAAAVFSLVSTPVQLILGAVLAVGLMALLAGSIVLTQYIGVGQGFLYLELKDASSES